MSMFVLGTKHILYRLKHHMSRTLGGEKLLYVYCKGILFALLMNPKIEFHLLILHAEIL
jgi:hypothetical protein